MTKEHAEMVSELLRRIEHLRMNLDMLDRSYISRVTRFGNAEISKEEEDHITNYLRTKWTAEKKNLKERLKAL
jgi:hypothetical protein